MATVTKATPHQDFALRGFAGASGSPFSPSAKKGAAESRPASTKAFISAAPGYDAEPSSVFQLTEQGLPRSCSVAGSENLLNLLFAPCGFGRVDQLA